MSETWSLNDWLAEECPICEEHPDHCTCTSRGKEEILLSTIQQLREELELKKSSMPDLEHNRRLLSDENDHLRQEIERLKEALEKMDDSKNPMLPRSEMARIARQALKGEQNDAGN